MAWLPGYSKRKPITITGGASGAQTDFQLKLNTVYDADMQADFDDLRFTQANGTTPIDAWLESKVNSDSAVVWAEFPTTPANTVEQTYYMYYGNAGAASDWDIGATFLFGDDFPGSSIDTGKWDGKTSNAAVSGGIMSYGGDNTMDIMRTITHFGDDVACRSKIKFLTPTSYINAFGFGDAALSHYSYIYTAYTPVKYGRSGDGANGSVISTNIPINSWFTADVDVLGATNMRWFYDGVEGTNSPKTTHPSNATDLEVIFRGRSSGVCIQSEWVIVHKYAANPPTYAFGSEESEPTGEAAPTSIFYGPFVGPLGGPI